MKKIFKIQNFKQYSDKEFIMSGDTIAFIGKNGSGKSSAIQAFETALMVKGFVKNPIKNGEKGASIHYIGKDIDGNPITIDVIIEKNNVTDNEISYMFNASAIVNNKPKSISDPKKIRELIGTYFPLTTENVLEMVKYTEGRRTFINDYLNQLISTSLKRELNALKLSISNAKNKYTEGNLYHTRTELNKKIELLSAEINALEVTQEDKVLIGKKPDVENLLAKLKDEYELHKDDTLKSMNIDNLVKDILDHSSDYSHCRSFFGKHNVILPDKDAEIKTLIDIAENELKTLWNEEQISRLLGRINEGISMLTKITTLESKSSPIAKVQEREKIFAQIQTIEGNITKAKERIKQIYVESKFPSGLEIGEDETIILNGFILDETTNSNTEVRIAILELLCNISTSEYVCVGDWSLFDKDSRKMILALAKKHNRIFIGQEVTQDEEVSLKTIIID